MRRSLFWAAVEAGAKAGRDGYRTGRHIARSGLSAVGALVDCGIPRQHAGAQWLTEFEEENEVLEVPLSADFNDEPEARECGGYPCGRCHGETMDWERKILADSGMCPGGWKLREAPVAAAPPENSRTNAGATSSRAVEEGLTEETPPVSSVSAAYDRYWTARTPAEETAAVADIEEAQANAALDAHINDYINYRGEQLSWCEYIQPAIEDVLTTHWWYASRDGEAGCHCSYRDGVDMTREQWGAHTASLIADRLEAVTLALPESGAL